MMGRTDSEQLFETFCAQHTLKCVREPEGKAKTVDYILRLDQSNIAVEIKQIESQSGFNSAGVIQRTVGSHVRQQINEARAQVQAYACLGMPTILLIHNTIDPLQLFGTEPHDFLHAMYGELTVYVGRSSVDIDRPFHGRNARLRKNANTSFSGIGHLQKTGSGAAVTVYENVFASNPLPFNAFPRCIDLVRVEIEHAD